MSAASALAGLDVCVHCGFCLQACPTYLVTGDEADGPRGRIVLMQALDRGALPAFDPGLTLHLDRCLGCRACEPVCPSGVAYGPALEESRRLIARERRVPFLQQVIHTVMATPELRRPLLGLARMVRPVAGQLAGGSRLGFTMGMLAATRPSKKGRKGRRGQRGRRGCATRTSPFPAPRAAPPLSLFTGCVMDSLFSQVHAATVRTLAANGYRMVAVGGQQCCGALHAHAGQHEQARALARQNVRAFETAVDAMVVVNSAGCGAALKDYGRWLADDPLAAPARAFAARVRDVTELLAERGPRPGAPLRLRLAYDPPCHLLHAQRVSQPVECCLAAVPGVERVAHADAELCCGSAGSYSLTQSAMSRAVLDRKLDALVAARPDVVATGNPGCVMQLGAGLAARGEPISVVHPVEVLDWSYRAAGVYDD